MYQNQLNHCQKEYDTILNEIKTRISIMSKLQNETEIVEKEHAKEENKNRKLRAQLENYKVPDVNDYVNAEDFLYNLEKELKIWERKVEIAEVIKFFKSFLKNNLIIILKIDGL